jgi:TolA-binding protein
VTGHNLPRWSLLLALWAGPALAGSRALDTTTAPDPDEVAAYRAARDRFVARMQEITEDTAIYVDFREQEERNRVKAGYADPLEVLETRQGEQRALAIDRFESFLRKYPTQIYADHVRFRLAELYYELATEDWQRASAAYFAKVEDPNLPIDEVEALGPPPTRDLSRSIALYQAIIEVNKTRSAQDRYERLDGTYLMLGFVYNDSNATQYDQAKANETFAALIAAMPESELADRSHLFLGNFAFAENQFDPALTEYRLVYDKGRDGKYFEDALYQLAWAQYKLSRYDEALRLFTELLDLSEQRKADAGRESAFAPDARRFMAFSFADIAFDKNIDGDAVASEYFAKIGPRPYEREVLQQLTDVLVRYSRYPEAVAAYSRLQSDPRWKLEANNPSHQIEIIGLLNKDRLLEEAGAERLEFIDNYAEGTPWWDANRDDPEALEVARKFIEGSLLEVAIEFRVRAQDSGKPEDYLLAAQKYEEYLDRFPMSDDFYTQQYFLADTLTYAGRYDEALGEFQSLLKSRSHHVYGDAALFGVFMMRQEAMKGLGHTFDAPPAEPQVERSYPVGEEGRTIDVLALSQDRQDFLASADAVLGHTFTKSEDENLPDYQAEVDRLRPAIMYLQGQMLFYHNRYDEARARFVPLIEKYPRTLEANYAAGLLVDSYSKEENLEQVRYWTRYFTNNPPGPASDIDPERFKGTLEGATFKLALEEAEKGEDPERAAQAFIDFRKEFPKSQFKADALYNAAFYYQQAGKVTQSNELYEQFVAENPTDKRSLSLYFRIAANYEAAFELDRAIDYYDRILRHPNSDQAQKADAQYNKSFLQIGLGRHREAALGYEAYEKNYPEVGDREQVYYRAGEQWEKVSTGDAIDFYNRYKQRYPDANADRYLEAEYRLLELYRKQGADAGKLRRQQDQIIASFERFAKSGKPIGPNGHAAAAGGEYPKLSAEFTTYADVKLTGNEDRDDKLINTQQPAALKGFEAKVDAFIGKYKDFEYNSGALLLKAKAALAYADLGLSLKCPKGMSEEDCWLYEDILQEKVFPQFYAVEEVGIKRLQELIDGAKAQKRHSRFIDEAMAELNKRDPGKYPAVKRELTGAPDATMPVDLVPRKLRAPETPDPTPAPAPVPTPGGQ